MKFNHILRTYISLGETFIILYYHQLQFEERYVT